MLFCILTKSKTFNLQSNVTFTIRELKKLERGAEDNVD